MEQLAKVDERAAANNRAYDEQLANVNVAITEDTADLRRLESYNRQVTHLNGFGVNLRRITDVKRLNKSKSTAAKTSRLLQVLQLSVLCKQRKLLLLLNDKFMLKLFMIRLEVIVNS